MLHLDTIKSFSQHNISDILQSARDHMNQKSFFKAKRQTNVLEKLETKLDINDIIFRGSRSVKMDDIITQTPQYNSDSQYQLIPLQNQVKLFRSTKVQSNAQQAFLPLKRQESTIHHRSTFQKKKPSQQIVVVPMNKKRESITISKWDNSPDESEWVY